MEVCVETSPAYLVASRLCDDSLASPCQKRTKHHHAASQLPATFYVCRAAKILVVELPSRECVVVSIMLRHFHTHVFQELYLVLYIDNVGDVLDADRFVGQQHSA